MAVAYKMITEPLSCLSEVLRDIGRQGVIFWGRCDGSLSSIPCFLVLFNWIQSRVKSKVVHTLGLTGADSITAVQQLITNTITKTNRKPTARCVNNVMCFLEQLLWWASLGVVASSEVGSWVASMTIFIDMVTTQTWSPHTYAWSQHTDH